MLYEKKERNSNAANKIKSNKKELLSFKLFFVSPSRYYRVLLSLNSARLLLFCSVKHDVCEGVCLSSLSMPFVFFTEGALVRLNCSLSMIGFHNLIHQ